MMRITDIKIYYDRLHRFTVDTQESLQLIAEVIAHKTLSFNKRHKKPQPILH
jgi:hypothetical protein